MSLSLCMIVKNEAHVIRRCLRSVKPFIDSYSISDTGSTDDTMDIIREEMAGIPGVLHSDPWLGFGPSRNVALRRASGTHVLSLDADEELIHLNGPIVLEPEFDHFFLKQLEKDMVFWVDRIIRNDARWEWRDKVHNYLYFNGAPKSARLENLQIKPHFDSHQNVCGNKILKHLAHYESAPATPRNVFYHAQTLRCLHRYEEAISKYEERARMGGWAEEVYYSLWIIGILKKQLGRPFEEVEACFRAAHQYRPTRHEARVALCRLYRDRGRWPEVYQLSLADPAPPADILFVDASDEWHLLEEHGIAAYWLGKIDEAQACFERVLSYPLSPADRERAEKNLGYCLPAPHPPQSF